MKLFIHDEISDSTAKRVAAVSLEGIHIPSKGITVKGEKKMTTKIITNNGDEMDFAVLVNMMDDDIREELHSELAPCTEQEFYNAYCEHHFAKYGSEFFVN